MLSDVASVLSSCCYDSVCFGGLRLLLHKAKTASAKWRDEADEVSESKCEAVKAKVRCIPPLSRAKLASNGELWSSLCKQRCSARCNFLGKLMPSPAPRRLDCCACDY